MTEQELKVQEKKKLAAGEERTVAGRHYTPYTDIFEREGAIVVVMDMPGVSKESVDVTLENDVLTITGQVSLSNYEGLEPVYTEYDVGNFTRSFTVSSRIDQGKISAKVADGVLEVVLPKAEEAGARRIEIR